ncbi:MAG: Outer membrane protein MIP precursor [Bacteroidetes bacterium ADurb.Bin408]|nr:MAG: Outer membrane protein MIP precursor [Bacteroidetes bacterium ADurb.Bin408]
MKKMKLSFVILVTMLFSMSIQAQSLDKMKLQTKNDSISYAIGMDVAVNLKSQSINVNPEAMAKGLIDHLNGKKVLLTDSVKIKIIEDFQIEHQKKQEELAAKKAEENKKAGQQFLENNKKKAGIKETASGLQYEVIKEGTGKAPTLNSKVTVHYEGKLVDGSIFDSSYERNEPITFPLNGVIQGWQEGLQLMKEGSTYMLYIPSNLGYGERGAGQVIPGNATLIFKVELIKVEE